MHVIGRKAILTALIPTLAIVSNPLHTENTFLPPLLIFLSILFSILFSNFFILFFSPSFIEMDDWDNDIFQLFHNQIHIKILIFL